MPRAGAALTAAATLLALVLVRNAGALRYAARPGAAGWPALLGAAALAAALWALARRRRPAWEGVLVGLLAYCAFCALVRALAPPTEWDVLAYHLAIPKLYAQAGRVYDLPWLLHSRFPHLMETLYALPLALGLENGPALLHAAACAAWLAAAYRSFERAAGRAAALLAVAICAAHPVVVRFAGSAHSDGAWALFHLLAGLCLFERRLALSAVFAGLAISCKLLGLLSLPGWALWIALRDKGGARAAVKYSALALLVAAPWFLKTYLATGNPVWPFYAVALGGRFGAESFLAAYEASNRLPWPPPAWMLLKNGLPVLALLLAGAALLRPRGARPPALLAVLWFPAPLHVALTASHQEFGRFFWPFLPAAALTFAWACAQAWRAGGLRRRAAGAAAALALAPAAAASCNNELFGALRLRSLSRPGLPPREAYLSRALDHYDAYREFDRLLHGKSARVLLYREVRGYHLEADYVWGDPLNQGVLAYSRMRDDRELEARLRLLRVTHVLVNEGTPMYRPGGPVYDERIDALMTALLRRSSLVSSSGDLRLYALAAPKRR